MYRNRPLHAISVLHAIVAVVPRTSILCCVPKVAKVILRCYGALCYAINSVHMHRQPLPDPMLMNTGAVMGKIVVNSHIDCL